VEEGQRVKSGDPLGHGGTTRHVNAEHLHFEVRQAGIRVDPLTSYEETFLRTTDLKTPSRYITLT
jgi:murein DD-endopeptidase MepM/ murein hydrolase activator NlpD